MSYLKEATNNLDNSIFHLIKYGNIELACIYCQNIHNLKNKELILHRNKTLYCYKCGIDAMIPITEDSVLNKMTNLERNKRIKEWYIEGFKSPKV